MSRWPTEDRRFTRRLSLLDRRQADGNRRLVETPIAASLPYRQIHPLGAAGRGIQT